MPANQWERRLTFTEKYDVSTGSKGIPRDPEVPFGWATSGGCSFVKLLRPSLSQTVFEPGTFHRWAWLEVSEVQFVQRHRVTYQRDWLRIYHYVSSTFFRNSTKSMYSTPFCFHHHRSHKLAIMPPDWICETHRCQKTTYTFNVSWFQIGSAWPTNPFPASSLHLLLMAVMGAAKIRGAFVLSSVPGRHTSQQPPGSICGLQRCNGRDVSLVQITISNGAPEWAMI